MEDQQVIFAFFGLYVLLIIGHVPILNFLEKQQNKQWKDSREWIIKFVAAGTFLAITAATLALVKVYQIRGLWSGDWAIDLSIYAIALAHVSLSFAAFRSYWWIFWRKFRPPSLKMLNTARMRKTFNQNSPPVLIGGFYLAFLWVLSEYSWFPVETMQTPVLIITGLIIIWYTWETRQLGKETRRQTELQLRPFVMLKPVAESLATTGFEVYNVGNGTALNVRIGDVIVSEIEEITIRFPDTVPVVCNGESLPISAHSLRKGNVENPPSAFLEHLNPRYTNTTFQVEISFQNVEARSFFVRELIGPKKLTIVGLSSE